MRQRLVRCWSSGMFMWEKGGVQKKLTFVGKGGLASLSQFEDNSLHK